MKDEIKKVYGIDASRLSGIPLDVYLPKTIAEAKEIIMSNKRIVPRGAATGLAGGAIPSSEDIVVDMSKLDSIEEFDIEQRTVVVEAGVILDDLQEYLQEYGLEFPIKPSSHAVATIAGMIATDAVGNRAVKYGKTSHWIKWIEVIDGYGRTLKKGITELSDYSGLEGITGVISRACLKLSPIVTRTATVKQLDDINELIEKVKVLKRNENISALEFIDKGLSQKLELEEKYTLIIEYEDDSGELANEEYKKIMQKRDSLYPLIAQEGYSRIEDPKIMVDKFDKLMSWLEDKKIPTFGHIGVGILHPCFNHDQEKYIPEMMKVVQRLSGQISGEHGIGILKREFLDFNDKKILENIKKRTDTLSKFNIGKVIRE